MQGMNPSVEMIFRVFSQKQSVFLSGEAGIVDLQQELFQSKKLELQLKGPPLDANYLFNSNGIFLKFSKNGEIYSGIVQCKDPSEAKNLLIETPAKIRKEGAEVLAISIVPLHRIPIFPMSTIFDAAKNDEKLARQYWNRFSDDAQALISYYSDLIQFRRELIELEFPQLELALPDWMNKLSVFVLYNEAQHAITTKYYRSLGIDEVKVAGTTESMGIKTTEEAFSKAFSLPPKEYALSESVKFNLEQERPYHNWSHPLIAAINDIKQQINKFNRAQPREYYDAYNISQSSIKNWTFREISETRALVRKFPCLKEILPEEWLNPLQVVIRYSIGEPVENMVADGRIAAMFAAGPEDSIMVEQMKNFDDVRYGEEIFKQYFPDSSGKFFFGFALILFKYLEDKFGDEF
jgi:hypothetical protein